MIEINDITLRIGSKVLLEHASAHISDGQKVGLVGANGCGKSTLFRVLKGELETETGSVFFPNSYRVVFVEQEMRDIDVPILDFLLSTDRERTELLQRLETASGDELAEIHERLNMIEAASAPARAAGILHGLGFKNEDLSRPIREFSGGWRMRLALAAALFQPSEVLLLDEPTNHLDLEAGMWLENHLQKYRGTLVIISHDRNILNALCDYIVHFDNLKLVTYSGNYDTFQNTRSLRKEQLQKQAEKQEQKRRHLQSFVDRFRYKASKAKQAQSRIKMLEKMEILPPLEDDAFTCFEFPDPLPLPPPLITLEDVSVGYGEKVVLKHLNLSVVDNDRIALLGANGNGKSTLAKLLSGRLSPLSGELKASPRLKVGYFAQHQTEELPLDMTALQYMSSLMPGVLEPKVRAHLARFGLSREKALTEIEKLSGGEKARLLFAVMTRDAPGLLILDEPTNHLDIDGREALTAALNAYAGSVILITHDLHLIELIADSLWLVKDGNCRPYTGDLDDYRKLLLEENNVPSAASTARSDGRQQREQALARRSEVNSLRTKVSRLDKSLDELHLRQKELTSRFLNITGGEEVIELQKQLSALEKEIAAAEEEWLNASGRLEELTREA